jgi:hypothetical protein
VEDLHDVQLSALDCWLIRLQPRTAAIQTKLALGSGLEQVVVYMALRLTSLQLDSFGKCQV